MIIGFLGNLQSGKSSSCRYVAGEIMKKNGLIKDFEISEEGSLVVPDIDGNYGVFDIEGRTQQHKFFRQTYLDSHIKILNFADPLKEDCCKYFGIPEELAWGGKKDKETLLKITWADIEDVFLPAFNMDGRKKKKRMSVRDILITYADMVRSINPKAFVNAALTTVDKFKDTKLFVVGDVRYQYEIDAIHEANGKVIRLKKIVEKTDHSSEQTDSFSSDIIDLDIDNSAMTIKEKNAEIKKALIEWGVL